MLRETMNGLSHELQFAARSLRRSPGFTALTVLILTLAIGVTVTIFSVMYAVLWRPLPYPNADRLVVVETIFGTIDDAGLAQAEVVHLRQASKTLQSFAMINGVEAFVSANGEMEHVSAATVTDDLLPLLGAVPAAPGRRLQAANDIQPSRVAGVVISRVAGVVISHDLKLRLFGSASSIVGQRININNMDLQVVGVAPSDLRVWMPPSAMVEERVDVWFPGGLEHDWRREGPATIARLTDGVTLSHAQAELDVLAQQLSANNAAVYKDAVGALGFRVRPLRDAVAAPAEKPLFLLGAAVAFVLLVGCANVANLMLVRATARRQQIAVQQALGASRARIGVQLAMEGLLLGVVACVLGLLVAQGGIALISWLRPTHLPRESAIAINGVVALVAIGLSIAAAIACSLAPVTGVWREHDNRDLATRAPVSAGGARRMQRALVVAEVALSIVPLVAAGLMLRSFANLNNVPLGFDANDVLTARVPFSLRQFSDPESRLRLQRQAVAAVKALSGVEAVSAVHPLPFSPSQIGLRIRRDAAGEDEGFLAMQQVMLPGYLDVAGIPLLRGRDVNDDDINNRQNVAVVDERFARMLSSGDPLGKQFYVGRRVFEVVGVTPSVRVTRVRDEPRPHFFVPYHVRPAELSVVLKTRADFATMAPVVKRAIESTGNSRAVYDVRPMADYTAESVNETRFLMLILVGFASVSLLLTVAGLYATLAYLVSRRTQEFGVRLALGASTHQVVRLVAGEGARLTAVGATIGAAGAVGAARLLSGLLYGIAPLDWVTFAVVAGVIAIVALIASAAPAMRAARVDPLVALRYE
jgi:putative ABC transport system permease protein